jgi:hypothetical protein
MSWMKVRLFTQAVGMGVSVGAQDVAVGGGATVKVGSATGEEAGVGVGASVGGEMAGGGINGSAVEAELREQAPRSRAEARRVAIRKR